MPLPKPYATDRAERGVTMEFANRKSTRIHGYDYSTPNYYFVTICTHNRKCIFGNPGNLNVYGVFAEEYLLQISRFYPSIKVDKFVVMPNHIHAIVIVQAQTKEQVRKDLTAAVGQYKMSVTKKIRKIRPGERVWQRSFHDHIIRNQYGYQKIWEYIDNNPQKWEEDCFYWKEVCY